MEQNKDLNIWNLSHLYASDNDPKMKDEILLLRTEYSTFENKWRADESYLTDPEKLFLALEEKERLDNIYGFGGKIGYYWALRSLQNQSDEVAKENDTRSSALEREMQNLVQFFDLKLSKISEKQQKIFLSDARLLKYRHYLEYLFATAKYILSEAEEKILNLMSQPANEKWISLRSEFIGKESMKTLSEDGKITVKPFAEILDLIASKDKKVRDGAAKNINKIMAKLAPLAEYELNAVLLDKKIRDELRGFTRPDQEQHVTDDIETPVVDVLVDSVTANFDIAQKFYQLKAKLMKIKKLKYHERMVPYGSIDEEIKFQDAIALVSEVFYDLDSEFGDIFTKLVKDGLIDAFPKVGKRSGAACYSAQMSAPTYIYLNYTNKLREVQTLAHECGHGLNNELSKKKNHALDFGISLATAEVASTFMEDFVTQKVAKNLTEEKRLALLITQLDDMIATIFRQIACYNFETELHNKFREKSFLSSTEIGKLFLKHMASYMGAGVEMSKGAENWWVYWSHIRRPFYVYSYASGLLISKAMQNRVKADKSYVQKVKTFLAAGRSKSPKDIFMEMGIDITQKKFWDDGITEIRVILEEAQRLAQTLHLIS